jgi:transposase
MYLFVTTRHGVSGKELQRQLGVTYKTAWRIGQQIRELAGKADMAAMLSGHVEADEAYVGGVRSGGKRGRGAPGKTVVVGLVERGGAMKAMVAGDVKKATPRAIVNENVEKGSVVSTDELPSYNLLTGDGYTHGAVKHGRREYAYYDHRQGVNHHVNHVESFWKLFKDSVRSTHIHISPKYMNRYLGEFTFRANHRDRVNGMFDLLVGAL